MKKIFKYASVALLAGLLHTPYVKGNSMGLYASSSSGGSQTGTGNPVDIITTPGTITDWSTVTATGSYTFPPAYESLSTLDVKSTGAGTLDIFYSVAGITTPGETLDISLTANNLTAGITVKDYVWTDTGNSGNNVDDNAASLLGAGVSQVNNTLTLTGVGAVIGSGAAPGTPYSLTEEFVITATGANQTAQFQAAATAVPDGGTTMIMLGGAFCVIGAIRRKTSSK